MSKLIDLPAYLDGNPYPGRGIALGLTPDGRRSVCVYFIMGRSANSRNRIFEKTGDGIRTRAYDESKVEDPSLIIYRAVRHLDGLTIVTNGDQTDTIYDGLKSGLTFEEALMTRTFEPDAPNYTPRISGILAPENDSLSYQLSILKSDGGDPAGCCRAFFSYKPALPGRGRAITTYVTDGSPLPSFEGEPVAIAIPDDVEAWAEQIWEALDHDNRISLYVRAEDLAGGGTWERLINGNE